MTKISLSTRVKNLEKSLTVMSTNLNSLIKEVEILSLDYLTRIEVAAAKGNVAFTYGRKVVFYKGWPAWRGTVIPRPHRGKEYGRQGDRLIWVLTDKNEIRGCYPFNLRIL